MYIYVDKKEGLATLPDALIKQVGNTELAMTILITPDKKLARAKASDVLDALETQGFYLQMPPSLHAESGGTSQTIAEANDLLGRGQ